MDNGLRQRILSASTPEEVENLLKLGSTYEYAANCTRNAWTHAARRRYRELTKVEVEVPKPTPIKQVNTPKNRKQRKDA